MGKNSIPRLAVWLVPIAFLLAALVDMPYGYYQLLRVLIFAVSVYLAVAESKLEQGVWFWALVACALIYNPIFKFSLGREIWEFVNVATIVFFAAHWKVRKMDLHF